MVVGQAVERKAWEEWNQRRVEAEREGREFDEPPPSRRDRDNGK